MNSASLPIFDFKTAVAREFAGRPTLRQIASRQLLSVLLEQLPWLAHVQPALESADPLMLDSPDPDTGYWTTAPFVDVVLQAMLDGKPLTLEPLGERHCNLGLLATHRFAGSSSEFDTRRLTGGSAALNALLGRLPEHFYQAQVDYWEAPGSCGQSRDRWLQLLLKMALLRNLPLQALDRQQQACVRGLIKGGAEQPPVFVVQANLGLGERQFRMMQAGLLVVGEWDEREVVLWCAPSSQVRAFASLEDFALALRDELALRFDFDVMTWDRHQLEGNVFAQQSALLLSLMLDDMARLHSGGLGLARLEECFAALSDPARWFIDGYYLEEYTRLATPPGVDFAPGQDNFEFQEALLDVALAQAESEGVAALDGILDLHGYARQRLRERMLADHPLEANYYPDDLIIELAIARGVPGGAGVGSGGGEPLEPAGEKTLTEFALGNLVSLGGAGILGIRHRDDQLIMPWMTADYIKSLVQSVDIGGRYPDYVAQALDDTATRPARNRRFAREWRQSLVFAALSAKLDRRITQAGLQCVVDFCRGHIDNRSPTITLLPLIFKRQPASAKQDLVGGMYVLSGTEPGVVLLYRPLYGGDPLREYASIEMMMASIRTDQGLQQSMLAWMDPAVRHVYDNGGFAEPHVSSVGIDPYDIPQRPRGAELMVQSWQTEVDEKLYIANRELLVRLGDWQSVSDVESRWALLRQGAWLLFDVVALLLKGPVATVAWLLQAIGSVDADVVALDQGTSEERCAATVDLILNMGMALLHARLPKRVAVTRQSLAVYATFDGPPAQDGGYAAARVVPSQGKVGMPGPLKPVADAMHVNVDFSWRGAQGFNWLSMQQRANLMAMRSQVALEGLQASAGGLYEVAGNQYASMLGESFAVSVLPEGVRIKGREGQAGPWLVLEHGVWRIDARLRLVGGMPGDAMFQRFTKLQRSAGRLSAAANQDSVAFTKAAAGVLQLQGKVEALEQLVSRENARRDAARESEDASMDWAASERVLKGYQERLAELGPQVKQQRLQSIDHIEASVRHDKQQLDILKTMLEPKYGGYRKGGFEADIQAQQAELRTAIIRSTDFIMSELWRIAEYPRINDLAHSVEGLSLAEARPAYRQLRGELAVVVEYQERMLVAQGTLDSLLSDAPRSLDIGLGGTSRTVAELVAGRTFSVVDLRYHHALNLADLALRLDAAQGQRQLARFKAGLSNVRLTSAAGAHGELLMSNLAMTDRITILQEAWDEYATAIVNSLHIERTGGNLVEVAMLKRYRGQMELLKEDAGRRLLEAIAEQEGGAVKTAEAVYPVSVEVQRAVRNRDGQLVIATEVQDADGNTVLEVRAPVTKRVVQVFELRNGRWLEREREEEGSNLLDDSPTEAGAQVQVLLQEHAEILEMARSYVSGEALDRLLTQQGEKLRRAAAALQGGSEALAAELQGALDALSTQRNELLTALYSNTKYPTAAALRFLYERNLLRVDYVRRDTSRSTSPFDEFKITLLNPAAVRRERPIWAAHFHLGSQTAHLEDFTFAHLKLWSQRFQGHAYEVASGERVHRGPLVRADIAGIISLT
ncbi:dermonecrotic toxin domain-containing protein [Pseudomonas mosselii]|uniref:dermonecrotic toxin domain-containing protein n=1 Tax=Pseudomonas mosselii TaxID=78327 RepID=UPI000D854E15|nr:DUF6543 domain-containing protein [Pseudomonas mosselii]PYC26056.1 hypothetical protein DMX06_05160 [Pseudomonas mosselii]